MPVRPNDSLRVYLAPRRYHYMLIILRGDYISLDDDCLGFVTKIYVPTMHGLCIASISSISNLTMSAALRLL